MDIIGRDILTRNVFKRKTLPVPEWAGVIVIRELSGKEAIPINTGALEISQMRAANNFDMDRAIRWEAEIVCCGWINEDGSHVLDLADIDQLLESQPRSVIEAIAREIRILSGVEKERPSDPSPQEAAKKN